jgi:hypothetical protein
MSDELPDDFFRPTPKSAEELLEAGYDEFEPAESHNRAMIELAREDIALRLWDTLARVARANAIPADQTLCRLRFDEAFIDIREALRISIPLSKSSDGQRLISELLRKFFDWLGNERGAKYAAAWGTISLVGNFLEFSAIHIPRFQQDEEFEKADHLKEPVARSSAG